MTASQAGANRRQMLEKFVEKNPLDAFARYGLAMECAKEGDAASAETHFKQLLGDHAEYVAAYYQFGRLLALSNRIAEAREIFSAGIARAAQAGDEHARQELQAALDELS
ncbi:MAG TPA: tetratricopeptide repeat protein [Candidatus Acidoferrales bacterium]|nr:tetratricopeptide repeat protein [Candidatus Acidoferrales bacterium]